MDVKMSNNTINVLVDFIKQQDGWSMDELRNELISEGGFMKFGLSDGRKINLDADECTIIWGDGTEDIDVVCGCGDMVDDYGRRLLISVCNMLESFKNQECFLYKDDE